MRDFFHEIFFQSFVVNAFPQCNFLQYQIKKREDMVFSEIIKNSAYFALFFHREAVAREFSLWKSVLLFLGLFVETCGCTNMPVRHNVDFAHEKS